jgi:hypothetical protein
VHAVGEPSFDLNESRGCCFLTDIRPRITERDLRFLKHRPPAYGVHVIRTTSELRPLPALLIGIDSQHAKFSAEVKFFQMIDNRAALVDIARMCRFNRLRSLIFSLEYRP